MMMMMKESRVAPRREGMEFKKEKEGGGGWESPSLSLSLSLSPSRIFLSPSSPFSRKMAQWNTVEDFIKVHPDFEELDDGKVKRIPHHSIPF